MRPADVPMPAAVAARPRDDRGYPVLAITPWSEGRPRFAATGTARSYLCAVERRCSICGTPMAAGPVWRVVGGAEAEAIATAMAAGQAYRNEAATVEAPGHRDCMLYAAVVCPYLAEPTARRQQTGSQAGMARGERRGAGGAVVGFAAMEFRYAEVMMFRFADVVEFLPHDTGEEQLPRLVSAISQSTPATAECPEYLLCDEESATRRFTTYLDGR
ncbi:hypothetical protein [Hamadaea sp.]|uniref:hypothetical protein n=1 Tax=Hamadaea sp. TaxID=2024425 RepID=UPI0025C088FE|nr:hypothetical protein [Hamadaea sp.]